MTDKANEQGWGSTVKAASEQIKSATDAVAEKIRPTVGDAVADGLKTGGEYTKAGMQNTGDALGLKGSKVSVDSRGSLTPSAEIQRPCTAQTTTAKAHDDLSNLADDVKGELPVPSKISQQSCYFQASTITHDCRRWQKHQDRPRKGHAGC